MIVVKIEVKYICEKCDSANELRFAICPTHISLIRKRIDHPKVCISCGSPTRIARVLCRTIDDIFGNEMVGFWYCPDHEHGKYYPRPLRSAARNTALIYSWAGGIAASHIKVAKKGFPWV